MVSHIHTSFALHRFSHSFFTLKIRNECTLNQFFAVTMKYVNLLKLHRIHLCMQSSIRNLGTHVNFPLRNTGSNFLKALFYGCQQLFDGKTLTYLKLSPHEENVIYRVSKKKEETNQIVI